MPERLSVLVVDDDDVAVEALERALRKLPEAPTAVAAEDGLVALDILRGQHPSRRIEQPVLVLLDLNMPRMNGWEFLTEVRADPSLADTVIYVLSTSENEADQAKAAEHQVHGYLAKDGASLRPEALGRLLAAHAPG